jgi:hypothetical protein
VGGQPMKSVLVGNGINIQFGGQAYSNRFILLRIIFNAQAGKYTLLFGENPPKGKDIARIFKGLVEVANKARRGEYDDRISDQELEMAVKDFKKRYDFDIKKTYEIGLEDWFLLIRLFFIDNEDLEKLSESVKQGFERMILDAIYNDGFLQNIHSDIGKKVKQFIANFDNIFTLNYDNNLESLTRKPVFHLHGDYSVLADSENTDTLMGHIRATSGQLISISKEFMHCYCNALFDYSGMLKLKHVENIDALETELRKLYKLYLENRENYNQEIKSLNKKDRQLISMYVENPSLIAGTRYHFSKLKELTGELYIIGMSPNNDSHIFECINNSALDKVYFYYRKEGDGKIPKVPICKPYEMCNVDELWKELKVDKPKYNCHYQIPNTPDIDKFIDVFNILSGDEITKAQIISKINSTPQFEIDKLCKLVSCELKKQKLQGNPKSEDELQKDFHEISRIGLREGVFPSALFMMYIMNHHKNQKR